VTPLHRNGYALTAFAAVVWSLTSPGLKWLLDNYSVPPLTLAFWRDAFIAVACLVVLGLFRPRLLRTTPRELAYYALVGAVSIGIYHALWIWSITLNGAAIAIVLIYLFPVFVTLGSWLFFREPLRWPQIVALVISLAGCVLLVRAYDPAFFRLNWMGVAVGIATALTHSVYVLFSQRSVQTASPWTSLTYTMLFGALTLLVLTLLLTPTQVFAVGTELTPWLGVAFIALGPTLLGYAIFTMALRSIPGRIASLIVVLEVPIATMLSVVLLRETLVWPQIVGIGLILSAIVLTQLSAARTNEQPTKETTTTTPSPVYEPRISDR
jgi:drug/metabolite transporter (DMT)-like permease